MSNLKNKIKAIFLNQIMISILGLVVILIIAIPLAKNISKRYAINKEIKGLESEIYNLEKRNSNIKNLIDYFKSDSYVEEQARSNLNLKKEGENVVVIKDISNNTKSELINLPAEKSITAVSNPGKWLRYFIYN